MMVEIKAPVFPESIVDGVIVVWHKKTGEAVTQDEVLVDIETDKVVLEVPAPATGILRSIEKKVGETIHASEILGRMTKEMTGPSVKREDRRATIRSEAETPQPPVPSLPKEIKQPEISVESRADQRVPMSRLRTRIAERLVESQHTAAILTTFNEVNLQAIIDLRTKYKDLFEQTHKVRLGFMSFFVKASVEALKRFPLLNASVEGTDIIYHPYYDIGVAVSSPRGLVVPILRHAENRSLADMERAIANFAEKAREGKLAIEEISGGTFTVSNGGVFGSLLSTPILNPPQSAILGMHKIEDRPIVERGQIVIRPMMYLALSYDHRIIDGKEAVSFLVMIKELLENPGRVLLEL